MMRRGSNTAALILNERRIEKIMETPGKIIVFCIVVVLIICGTIAVFSLNREKEIKNYDVIIIDNHEYLTSEIESVDYPYYTERGIIITFKNGTVVHTSSYTLKNR